MLAVPPVSDGGSGAVDPDRVADLAEGTDLVAVAGTEALVAARRAGRDPDVRFGTAEAVREAATKGLTVLLLATTADLSRVTSTLRDADVRYEVIDDGR